MTTLRNRNERSGGSKKKNKDGQQNRRKANKVDATDRVVVEEEEHDETSGTRGNGVQAWIEPEQSGPKIQERETKQDIALNCPHCGQYEEPDPECRTCGGRGKLAPRVKRKLPARLEKYFEKRKKALIDKGLMTADGKFDQAALEKLEEDRGSLSTSCKIDLIMYFFLFSVLALVLHFQYKFNLPMWLKDTLLASIDPGDIQRPQ